MAWSSQVRLEGTASSTTHAIGAPRPAAGTSDAPKGGAWRSTPTHGGYRPIARPVVAAPPVVVASPTTLASFWRRLLATIIDNVVVSSVITAALPFFVNDFENRALVGMKAFYAEVLAGGQNVTDDLNHLVVIMTYTVITATVLYGGISLGVWSRTLGQRIVGIAVSPVDKPADKVGWSRGLARSLAWTLLSQGGGLFIIANAFSLSMILWHPKRQSLPDLLARTQVVRRG